MFFLQWLLTQQDRDDPIGDLARDVKKDKKNIHTYFNRPLRTVSLKDMYSYLNFRASYRVLEVLIEAYREWQELGYTYRETRKPQPRHS